VRVFVARMFITFGMWLLPAGVRKMVRGMMVFHVPEGLTDDERLEVIRAKDAWDRSRRAPNQVTHRVPLEFSKIGSRK
jgi:hypothetical protein